jgi:hypothetical protein
MLCFGLKFCNDGDCDEVRIIARTMVAEDEIDGDYFDT